MKPQEYGEDPRPLEEAASHPGPAPAPEQSDQSGDDEPIRTYRPIREGMRRLLRNRAAATGLAIVAIYLFIAIFGPWLTPHDPLAGDILNRLEGPSAEHWFGTDELGRDVMSRVIAGARISLQIQLAGVGVAVTFGVIWGLVSGYFGGIVDEISMRIVDVMMAFPSILLAISIVAILGGGFSSVIIAIGIASVPRFARLVRGVVLGLRELEYVEAARSIGESHPSMIFRYIMPGTRAPIIVESTLRMATLLLTAAALGFLGLGVAPPTPEWGAMLSNARDYMFVSGHVTIAPGIAITVVVIAFNVLGDGLRDALDPRMRE